MPIGGKCETCGAMPAEHSTHGYCAVCSKDLCPTCLSTGRCFDAADGKHVDEEENDDRDDNDPRSL